MPNPLDGYEAIQSWLEKYERATAALRIAAAALNGDKITVTALPIKPAEDVNVKLTWDAADAKHKRKRAKIDATKRKAILQAVKEGTNRLAAAGQFGVSLASVNNICRKPRKAKAKP